MALIGKLFEDRRLRIICVVLLVLTAVAAVIAWKSGVSLVDVKTGWKSSEAYLRANPWALFLAIVILPGLMVPASPLMVAAGLVWGQQPVMACGLALLGLALNLTWTYWLAAGPGRKIVTKILGLMSIELPALPQENHLKLILVLKLTPGIPLFFQNYMLGLLQAPFRLYLPVGVLCNGFIGIGIVLSGAGLSNGKLVPALTGISLIVLGVVFTQLVRGWLAKRKAKIKAEN